MKVNGKLYALATLFLRKTQHPLSRGLGGQFGKENPFPNWAQNPCSSGIQPVVQSHPVTSVEDVFRNNLPRCTYF
jgi:hypothetical protein